MTILRNDTFLTDQRLANIFNTIAPVALEKAQEIKHSLTANNNQQAVYTYKLDSFQENAGDKTKTLTAIPAFVQPPTPSKGIDFQAMHTYTITSSELTTGKASKPITHEFNMSNVTTTVPEQLMTAAQNTYTKKGNVYYPAFATNRLN